MKRLSHPSMGELTLLQYRRLYSKFKRSSNRTTCNEQIRWRTGRLVSHNCRRTNARFKLKQCRWTPSQESRLEQRHVVNYYSIPPLLF